MHLGTDPLDMTAQVSNPRGQTEDAEIVDCPDCRYVVRFVPSMDGCPHSQCEEQRHACAR